ncbi:MAG TPA: hypothetical protein O0X50_00275 [Methanocorpusculum sp.]|nr:hypothetical protein [Methanocorpusculum sp.]
MTDCSKCPWHCCGNCANTEPNALKGKSSTIVCKVLPKDSPGNEAGILPRSPCTLWRART